MQLFRVPLLWSGGALLLLLLLLFLDYGSFHVEAQTAYPTCSGPASVCSGAQSSFSSNGITYCCPNPSASPDCPNVDTPSTCTCPLMQNCGEFLSTSET